MTVKVMARDAVEPPHTDKRQRGKFWRASKYGPNRWRVVVGHRPQVGDEVIVRKKHDDPVTVVVTEDIRQFRNNGAFHARFAVLGTVEAENARRAGPTLARKKAAAKKPRPAPPPPAEFDAIRPRGCIGGMTYEQAKREARQRGPQWQPYECARCNQHHIEES